MKVFVLIATFAISVMVPAFAVNASAVDVDLSHYAKATHLANLGRYQQASQQWHRLTIIFLSSEAKLGRKRMWQYAGLSEALAAAAADKANSPDAYQYWADSTRYLMTGGTNWDQMRKKLHRRYERANTLLSTQLQVADLASSVDAEWQQELSTLQTWDEKLGLYRFSSPKLGLQDTRSEQATRAAIPPPKPMTTYQPRGGAKKLSGLSKTFSNEQQFVPVVAPSTSTPVQGAEGTITPTVKQKSPHPVNNTVSIEPAETSVTRHLVVSDADIKLETAPVMSKGIVISSPNTPELSTNQNTISLLPAKEGPDDVVPEKILPSKVAKGNSIGTSPVQAATEQTVEVVTEQAIESEASNGVVVTPIEAIEYDEQAVTIPTSNISPTEDLQQIDVIPEIENKTDSIDPPVLPRANIGSEESRGVEAQQRRSFAPVSLN